MKQTTSHSVAIDCRLVAGFQRVRERLLRAELDGRLDRPLAYWALASDRRLPVALLDRSVRELLATPFDALCDTPGIGPKKLAMLVCLLDRVAQADAPALERACGGASANSISADGSCVERSQGDRSLGEWTSSATSFASPSSSSSSGQVGAANVSEALWSQWRDTLRRHGLGREMLGRFAASLQDLPRGLWRAPLGAYAELSLSEIRSLKAHGEKRVGAVVAIFGNLHGILAGAHACPHLTARVVPNLVARVESWFAERHSSPAVAPWTIAELRDSWIAPMLEQLRIDAGEQVVHLVQCRLYPNSQSVQQTARRLGLTRGRVYETLADVELMLAVRWPEGREFAESLARELAARSADHDAIVLVESARQAFFPTRETALTSPWVGAALGVDGLQSTAGGLPAASGRSGRRLPNGELFATHAPLTLAPSDCASCR